VFVVRFGFSEFNSDTYGPIAYDAVLSLSGLSPDEDVKTRARMVQTLMELDHIMGSIEDRISTARGRAYSEGKIGDKHYSHLYLLKGGGTVSPGESTSAMFTLNWENGYNPYPNAILQVGRSCLPI
jgi:hypothetical protein